MLATHRGICKAFMFAEHKNRLNIDVSVRLPCLKEIPLQGEMSRSDKRVAVPARKGDRVSGGGILLKIVLLDTILMYLHFGNELNNQKYKSIIAVDS